MLDHNNQSSSHIFFLIRTNPQSRHAPSISAKLKKSQKETLKYILRYDAKYTFNRVDIPSNMIQKKSLPLVSLLLMAIVVTTITSNPSQAEGLTVDMELILDVDCSYGFSHTEYPLQMNGLARALPSSAVNTAIQPRHSKRIPNS